MTNPLEMFHYTTERNWEDVEDGKYIWTGTYENSRAVYETFRGLLPCRGVLPKIIDADLPGEAFEASLFGFPELKPDSWTANDEFPEIYGNLLRKILAGTQGKLVVVHASLLPSDNAQVHDWAYIERIRTLGLDKAERVKTHTAYWNSAIPLAAYAGQHSLPEIITKKRIPISRLEIVAVCDASEVRRRVHEQRYEGFLGQ
jgi:hypothetical protein